jgi:hypothetical protein
MDNQGLMHLEPALIYNLRTMGKNDTIPSEW